MKLKTKFVRFLHILGPNIPKSLYVCLLLTSLIVEIQIQTRRMEIILKVTG